MEIRIGVDHPFLHSMIKTYAGIIDFGFELIGKGTIERPYKITKLPEYYQAGISLYVKYSIDFLEIIGFNLSKIHLEKCKNVNIFNVNLRMLELKNCLSILVKNSTVEKNLNIMGCKKIDLQELMVEKYHIESSKGVSRLNCTINKFI